MIEVDPHARTETADIPQDIAARDLLLAVSRELARQAARMADLDAAIGAVALLLRDGPVNGRHGGVQGHLAARLQQADLLRQEMEGLVAIVELAIAQDPGSMVPTERLRSCTPLRDLCNRLVTPARD